jgi:site-specific DNA-methyltransferase (adenine-specific)
MIKIMQGDCLELMKELPDKSIDMILCDLPYGTTACKWDTIIPFEPLWEQYERIIKDNGAIVLFGSEPFSSRLRMSNIKKYKYDWIWNKTTFANQMCAKFQPLKIQENISVFSKKKHIYHPQGLIEINKITKQGSKITDNNGGGVRKTEYFQQYTNYPRNILEFKLDKQKLHSTQKPVALCEYLIKTYTNEGETVLDNCMGSGTTGVACINTKRNFIGIEKDPQYFETASERISKALAEANAKTPNREKT